MYNVLFNKENDSLILISDNNPDFRFYADKLMQLYKGNRAKCLQFIEEYHNENFIPEEKQIFLEIK